MRSVKLITRVSKCSLSALTHRPTIVLLLVYCPVEHTLFEVSPEIRCSGVARHYYGYGNHATGSGSKPI